MAGADALSALLELVRAAAREGAIEALASRVDARPAAPASPLLDKKALAYALGVSTATIDRMCRHGRVPFVLVGEVRRFDLEAVRTALGAHHEEARGAAGAVAPPAHGSSPVPGVHLLTRRSRG
jgi:hypothetical protein